eukprot:Blabericola_migrator_1__6224@NODE_313_length_10046_cov_122_852390_g256_i0_p7_GENE_NODE_313_length_10046_cov_122_852390_g256_i0NODE_313_length_10046_cov_122_852390_g256_i0_p7_ORF_typecomplete_len191_score43_23_NODE_313_length_10046_cov_122_852390_g256_i072847856
MTHKDPTHLGGPAIQTHTPTHIHTMKSAILLVITAEAIAFTSPMGLALGAIPFARTLEEAEPFFFSSKGDSHTLSHTPPHTPPPEDLSKVHNSHRLLLEGKLSGVSTLSTRLKAAHVYSDTPSDTPSGTHSGTPSGTPSDRKGFFEQNRTRDQGGAEQNLLETSNGSDSDSHTPPHTPTHPLKSSALRGH